MKDTIFQKLRERAAEVSREIGRPSFYRDYDGELEESLRTFSQSSVIARLRTYIDETLLHPAHGIDHGEKVAIEAAAILKIEIDNGNFPDARAGDLMLSAQIAGMLHDIKRREKDHPAAGSAEAGRILEDFDLADDCKRYITAAIRNHEAFREVLDSEDDSARLVSDALYDADKFRWGPENFTNTMWLIMESTGTTVEVLYRSFEEKMQWIRKIKGTFRTDTGRKYGPEFIDFGMTIGKGIYAEMGQILGLEPR